MARKTPTAPTIPAGYPTLTSGSADRTVEELCVKLNQAGYDVEIGQVVTPELLQAVNAFRRDNDVVENPDNVGGNPADVPAYIGPDTWAAILAI